MMKKLFRAAILGIPYAVTFHSPNLLHTYVEVKLSLVCDRAAVTDGWARRGTDGEINGQPPCRMTLSHRAI